MNILTEKIRWEDLVVVVEQRPGLLRDVAALRHQLHNNGPMTLIEMLEWQAQLETDTQQCQK